MRRRGCFFVSCFRVRVFGARIWWVRVIGPFMSGKCFGVLVWVIGFESSGSAMRRKFVRHGVYKPGAAHW